MATPQQGFQLGILPERQIDKRALAASYTFMVLLLLLLVNLGLIFPDRLQLKAYRVTELIPLPAMKPEPAPVKVKPLKTKLLPPAPVIEQPKLMVPHEVRRVEPKPEPVEAPKVVINTFAAPQIKMTAGGARPQLLHTGDFSGSSVAPTVNVAVQKVQTGGFGDPNGLTGTGKQGAKLYAAQAGGFDMPVGPGQGNGSGGAKGIKGTVASADFGSGIGSFANLKNLAVDYLKIDGSFFKNLARDTVNQAMVTAMIRLARTLNFKVIAEQVEDATTMDAARQMGVDYLQGFAVGRPERLPMAA